RRHTRFSRDWSSDVCSSDLTASSGYPSLIFPSPWRALMTIELLTTLGCHLCDQALELVNRAAPQLQVVLVDIAEEDAMIEQYGEIGCASCRERGEDSAGAA